MYEQAFRAYKLDVPTNLRKIKAMLDTYNGVNNLLPNVLNAYKAYVEEIANDYDNTVDKTKNLLVLQPQHFQTYINLHKNFCFYAS